MPLPLLLVEITLPFLLLDPRLTLSTVFCLLLLLVRLLLAPRLCRFRFLS